MTTTSNTRHPNNDCPNTKQYNPKLKLFLQLFETDYDSAFARHAVILLYTTMNDVDTSRQRLSHGHHRVYFPDR